MSATRLLIVDDEEKLLDLLRRFLERRGFQVDACASAEAAWKRFSEDPQGFALVITDLTLDGTSGADLIERVRRLRPGLPALITSGYPYVPVLPRVGFLQKPFLPKMLVDAVEQLLKRPA
jgi:DNA-binding NtrC family response regulator